MSFEGDVAMSNRTSSSMRSTPLNRRSYFACLSHFYLVTKEEGSGAGRAPRRPRRVGLDSFKCQEPMRPQKLYLKYRRIHTNESGLQVFQKYISTLMLLAS
mmetsp:Transcript_33618/g.99073  ORF Transcript_33618/g.99073 Transcript_33618/m.99073 type:complete len:101 (+) Transcript_33618:317-619(+)